MFATESDLMGSRSLEFLECKFIAFSNFTYDSFADGSFLNKAQYYYH